MKRFDEPREVLTVRRGWHVLRHDGTWGLVRHVARTGREVLLTFEDQPASPHRFQRREYVMTRNVAEQMAYAMWEREKRARLIRTRAFPRPTPMRLAG